jgi:PE family protein
MLHDRPDNRGIADTSDAVSVLTATQFNAHALDDRAVGAQSAAVVHQLGTAAVAAGFGAHATAETANVTAIG